jgi:hypothetical protein
MEGEAGATLIGEECHIVAREQDGPRGESELGREERDDYENLILLCCNHHALIDGDAAGWPVARVKAMKAEHEAWVRGSLAGDQPRQQDEEFYAFCIDEWERRSQLVEWDSWASRLLCNGEARLAEATHEQLVALHDWLFKRVWPGRYPDLEASFDNFRRVLHDLLIVFNRHGELESGDLIIDTPHKRLKSWDPPEHARLFARWEFYVDLVMDLALELTRAANLICDQTRRTILRSYRLEQGAVVVTSGPHMGLSWSTHRPRYSAGVVASSPYEGLTIFMTARASRDFQFGEGTAPSGD